MKEETTKAGRLYGVCSAGECIVTDAETGLVLANLDGSKQEAFFAIGSKVYLSDDAAVVTEAFNLAPCRGVVAMMLLRKAGGWLPAGFTELEYIEGNGTQYLQFDLDYSSDDSLTLRYVVTPNGTTFDNYDRAWGSPSGNTFSSGFGLASTIERAANSTKQTLYWGDSGLTSFPYIRVGELIDAVFSPDGLFVQGVKRRNAPTLTLEPIIKPFQIFAWGTSHFASMRWCGLSNVRDGKKLIELIPALRNSDGVAGMFDRVSKQFFVNQGTGKFGYRIKRTGETSVPMSLRDPYYTAPSGVYARLIAENELEVLADTEETTGDGWEWFANTAEAYEYFGIVQEDELLTE